MANGNEADAHHHSKDLICKRSIALMERFDRTPTIDSVQIIFKDKVTIAIR
jgi:hypothetical protein